MTSDTQPHNPYIAGNALTKDDDFYGREEILQKVHLRLSNDKNNVALIYGQRRIGKTSILYKLLRTLPSPPFFPVYIDLMDKAKKPIGEVLYDIASICAQKVEIELPEKKEFIGDSTIFHEVFLPRLLEKIGEDRRPIFLLDEFDVLDQSLDRFAENIAAKALHPYLRFLMAHQPRLGFVFVVGRRMEELTIDFLSTFRTAQNIPVFVLNDEDARSLIKRGEPQGLFFDEDAIQEILFLTRKHPYFTQLLCQEIFNRFINNKSNGPIVHASKQMVNDAIGDTFDSGNSAFQWIWEGLPTAERIVFSAIAGSAQPSGILHENEIPEILQKAGIKMLVKELNLAPDTLVKWEMLERTDEGYRFVIEIMRQWVERYRPLVQVKEEIAKLNNPLAETLYRTALDYYYVYKNAVLAYEQLRQALQLNPDNINAHLLLGTIHRENGIYEDAIREFKEAYRIDEREAFHELIKTMLEYGSKLEYETDINKALAIYSDILEIYPYEETARTQKEKIEARLKGDQYKARGELQLAYQSYVIAGMNEESEKIIAQLRDYAQNLVDQMLLVESSKIYSNLESLQPTEPEWKQRKADVIKQLAVEEQIAQALSRAKNSINDGYLEKAEEDISWVLSIRDDHAAHSMLNDLYKLKSTRDLVQKLITEAQSYEQEKNLKQAIATYQKIQRLQPEVSEWRSRLELAQDQLAKELKFEQDLELAKSAIARKNYSLVEQLLQSMTLVNPDHPSIISLQTELRNAKLNSISKSETLSKSSEKRDKEESVKSKRLFGTPTLVVGVISSIATLVVTLLISYFDVFSTGTPTATPSQSISTPSEVLNYETSLDYSQDLAKWGMDYYYPNSIELSETSPNSNWIEPSTKENKRFYGNLKFGDNTEVGVILDEVNDTEYEIVMAFDGDLNFSDNPVYKYSTGAEGTPIEFQVNYTDESSQKYSISIYYFIGSTPAQLLYYRTSVRQGSIQIGSKTFPVVIGDNNADGLYSDLENVDMVIDLDNDGQIVESEIFVAASPIQIENSYYIVSNISPSGSTITISNARFGQIAGVVTDSQSGQPLNKVIITFSPTGLTTVTDSNGFYNIQVPEGRYFQVAALLDGYVPNYLLNIVDPVSAEKTLSIDISMQAATAAKSGTVRLEDGDSYHFLAATTEKYIGGDFYFGFSNGKAQFWANNLYQQGLIDLGDLGSTSLDQVEPPTDGYYRFGVEAIINHTYVTPAKEGETGHYVIFRVTQLEPDQYVEIEFYYH